MNKFFCVIVLAFSSSALAYSTLSDFEVGDLVHDSVFTANYSINSSGLELSFRNVATNETVLHKSSGAWNITKVGKKLVDCYSMLGDNGSTIRVFSISGELESQYRVPFLCAVLGPTATRAQPVVIGNTIVGPVYKQYRKDFLGFELTGFLTVNVESGSYTFREVTHEIGHYAWCYGADGSNFMAHLKVTPGVGYVEGMKPTLYDHVKGVTITGETVKGEDQFFSLENRGYWFLQFYIRDPNLGDFEASYIFDGEMKLKKTMPIIAAEKDDNYSSVLATDWGWIYLNKNVIKTMALDGAIIAEMKQNEAGFFDISDYQDYSSLKQNGLGGNYFVTFKRSIGSACFDKLVLLDSMLNEVKENVRVCGAGSGLSFVFVTSKGTILSGDNKGLYLLDQDLKEIWREDFLESYALSGMLENESGDLRIRYLNVKTRKYHELTVLK